MAIRFCCEQEILTGTFPQHFPGGSGRTWQHQDRACPEHSASTICGVPEQQCPAFPSPQTAPGEHPQPFPHPADTQLREAAAAGTSTGTLCPDMAKSPLGHNKAAPGTRRSSHGAKAAPVTGPVSQSKPCLEQPLLSWVWG